MSASVNNTAAQVDGKTLVLADSSETITGLKAFDRGAGAPFGVASGAAKVTYLDADLLDGLEGTAYARTGADNTLTGVQTATAQPRVILNNSVVQTVADATDAPLTFDTEVVDVGGLHAGGAPTRITIPEDGFYLATATVRFDPDAGLGPRYIWLAKNGGVALPGTMIVQIGDATVETRLLTLAILPLVATDYLEAIVYQDSGGTLDCGSASAGDRNAFSAVKLW